MTAEREAALEALAEQLLDTLLSEGHYGPPTVDGLRGCPVVACPWCELFEQQQSLPDPRDEYSEYGSQVETVLLLWDNEDADTRCQAMICCTGEPDVITEIVARLATREPAEDADFLANLARHRAETSMWGCRA